jgi:hypothetical protein
MILPMEVPTSIWGNTITAETLLLAWDYSVTPQILQNYGITVMFLSVCHHHNLQRKLAAGHRMEQHTVAKPTLL